MGGIASHSRWQPELWVFLSCTYVPSRTRRERGSNKTCGGQKSVAVIAEVEVVVVEVSVTEVYRRSSSSSSNNTTMRGSPLSGCPYYW